MSLTIANAVKLAGPAEAQNSYKKEAWSSQCTPTFALAGAGYRSSLADTKLRCSNEQRMANSAWTATWYVKDGESQIGIKNVGFVVRAGIDALGYVCAVVAPYRINNDGRETALWDRSIPEVVAKICQEMQVSGFELKSGEKIAFQRVIGHDVVMDFFVQRPAALEKAQPVSPLRGASMRG